MDNLLPGIAEFDAIAARTMPNQQWEPLRGTYTKGTMLPARLRVLVALTQAEQGAVNPGNVVVSSTERVTELLTPSGVLQLRVEDPSPLSEAARGYAPIPRISKVGGPSGVATSTCGADDMPALLLSGSVRADVTPGPAERLGVPRRAAAPQARGGGGGGGTLGGGGGAAADGGARRPKRAGAAVCGAAA
jgi:hypothetical protein